MHVGKYGHNKAMVPVVSLFSGAGGLDLGVEDAGGDIVVAVEPDPDCISTLTRNRRFFPSLKTVIPRPIEELSTDEILEEGRVRRGEVALLIAGPPCQPFSKSAYWLQEHRKGTSDPRASLLERFFRVLHEARPEAFILENVASLIHPSHLGAFEGLLYRIRSAGYVVEWRLIHAVEFGVPQTRSRIFVLGLRGRCLPKFPQPTHWWNPNGSGDVCKLRPPETAGRWIAHLDKPEFSEPEEVFRGKWLRQVREVPPGWNYKYLTSWARYPRPVFVAESKYWTFLLKLSPHRPSWTIQASAGPWTGPFHWDNRRLRVRELAALQTFPASYEFAGHRRAQRRQIGNAVPPLLASRLAAGLLESLLGERPRRGRRLRYRFAEGYDFRAETTRHRGPRW